MNIMVDAATSFGSDGLSADCRVFFDPVGVQERFHDKPRI
jgi:hypothetical protein